MIIGKDEAITIPGRINSAVGNNSLDLGTLCQSSNINRWAKHKSVRITTVSNASKKETDTISIQPFGASGLVNVPVYVGEATQTAVTNDYSLYEVCGINVPICSSAAAAIRTIEGYASNNANWKRATPGNWHRQLAFQGYDSNAVAPFYHECKANIYSDTKDFGIIIEWTNNSEYSLSLGDFMNYFGTGWEVVGLLRKSGSTAVTEIATGAYLNSSSDCYIPLPSNITAGNYSCFVVAKKGMLYMPFPADSSNYFANPLSFRYIDSPDPSHNPISKVSIDFENGIFGYTATNWNYYEDQFNVGQGPYVRLCTNGKYAIGFDMINNSNSALTFDGSKFAFTFDYAGASGGGHPVPIVYVEKNDSKSQMGSSYSLAAGQRARVWFDFNDIFSDGSGRYPVQECISGSTVNSYGGDMIVTYDGVAFNNNYIAMELAYTTGSRNGYFHSYANGFYLTK